MATSSSLLFSSLSVSRENDQREGRKKERRREERCQKRKQTNPLSMYRTVSIPIFWVIYLVGESHSTWSAVDMSSLWSRRSQECCVSTAYRKNVQWMLISSWQCLICQWEWRVRSLTFKTHNGISFCHPKSSFSKDTLKAIVASRNFWRSWEEKKKKRTSFVSCTSKERAMLYD